MLMSAPNRARAAACAALTALILGAAAARQEKPHVGYKDTPMLPGGRWHVHDGDRPQPPVVTPGAPSTQEKPGTAPSDAVVLFDGKDLSHWASEKGGPPGWRIDHGDLIAAPGAGGIVSRDEFGDCQLHLEFASPNPPVGRDQDRGNSGVIFFRLYEVQVLDSFESLTYPDGQAAAIYGQYPPMVNASRPPGRWQSYDIIFTAPRFKEDGELEAPAYNTMLHNGVLVHDHAPLLGPMTFRGLPKYAAHGPAGPLLLQDHGHPVRFRNIWVRPIDHRDTH